MVIAKCFQREWARRISLKRGTEGGLRRGNLSNKAKEHKGGFIKKGIKVDHYDENSYLMRNESGGLVKRGHCGLKGLMRPPSEGEDVIKGDP
jgi:hypothetical protein